MEITLRNLVNQGLTVGYFDLVGTEQQALLPALSVASYQVSAITQATQGLIDQQFIRVESGVPVVQQYPLTTISLPLSLAGMWVQGRNYAAGQVVLYAGNHWACLNDHKAINPPSVSNPDWEVFSVADSSSFLGIDVSTVTTGQIIAKTSTGWAATLIGDAQVSAINLSKITGLSTALTSLLPKAGGTMTGALTLSGTPTAALHAATKSYVDNTALLKTGGTMTGPIVLSGAPTDNTHATNKSYVDQVVSGLIGSTGGTVSGHLILTTSSFNLGDAVNRQWVENNALLKAGGTLTGAVVQSSYPTANNQLVTGQWVVDTLNGGFSASGAITYTGPSTNSSHIITKGWADGRYVGLAGGTMTGLLTLSGVPVNNLHAATKQYVDSGLTAKLALSGGTMTGTLVLAADPTNGLEAATKQYVDNIVTGGGGAPLLLSGGTMTGAIILASLASGTGLYQQSTLNNTPVLSGQVLQSFASGQTVSGSSGAALSGTTGADCTVEPVWIALPSAADLPIQERLVYKSDSTANPAYVIADGAGASGQDAAYVLSNANEAISWLSVNGRWVARNLSQEVARPLAVRTEDLGSGTVSISATNLVDTVLTVTSVTNQSGNARLTLADTTGVKVGSVWLSTDNTGAYPGQLFTITGVVDATHLDTDHSFVSDSTFAMSGQREVVDGTKRVSIKLSTDPSDPFAEPPDNWSLDTGDSAFQLSGTSTWMVIQTLATGTAQVKVANAGAASVGYLHVLSAGRRFGSISAVAIKQVTAASTFTYQNVTIGSDSGTACLVVPVGSLSLFEIGESIVLSNATVYNGTRVVTAINQTTGKVKLDIAYSVAEVGDVDWTNTGSSRPIQMTVNSTTSLSLGTLISARGVTRLGGNVSYSGIIGYLDNTAKLVVIRSPYLSTGNQTGILQYSPVLRLSL